MKTQTVLEWWASLDHYWSRFFKIYLHHDFSYNREEREKYVPTEQELKELVATTHLEVRDVSVTSLRPLESLSLKSLSLVGLGSLISLTGLEKLDLISFQLKQCRQINDLSPLESQVGLRSVTLENNTVGDIRCLGKLQELREVRLSGNNIHDVSFLSHLENLQELSCTDIAADFSALASAKKLTTLYIENAKLRTLESIAPLPTLTRLYLHNAVTDSLKGLEQMPALHELVLTNCTVADLDVAAALPDLTVLDVSRTQINDLFVLNRFEGLRELLIPEDNFNKEAILAYRAAHPQVAVFSERGRNFPFMKYKTYRVTKKVGDLKTGMIIRFIDYTYNHYDGVNIYYFQASAPYRLRVDINDQEDFSWRDYVVSEPDLCDS